MKTGTLHSPVSRNMCLLLHRLLVRRCRHRVPTINLLWGLNLCLSIWQHEGQSLKKYQIQTDVVTCSWAQVLKKITRTFSRTPSIVLATVWFQKAFTPLIGNEDNFQSFSPWYHRFRQTCSHVLPYYCYSDHRKCRWASTSLSSMLNQLQIVHLDALQFIKSGFHCGLSFTSKLFIIFIIAMDRRIENMFINFSDDLNLERVT